MNRKWEVGDGCETNEGKGVCRSLLIRVRWIYVVGALGCVSYVSDFICRTVFFMWTDTVRTCLHVHLRKRCKFRKAICHKRVPQARAGEDI